MADSSLVSHAKACAVEGPHICADGRSLSHTAGRRGSPNSRQRLSLLNWTQRTPAALPPDIPGIGELIEGAMQQAPQPGRHATATGSAAFSDFIKG